MLWLTLAAQLAAPAPVGPVSWVTGDDMPAYFQQAGVTRTVQWRAIVSPTGSIESCGIIQSSGDPKMDSLTCSIVTKRGRFLPARWIDGAPVEGVFYGGTTWAVGYPAARSPTAIVVAIDLLPKHTRSAAFAEVVFAVHEDGTISDCAGAEHNEQPLLVVPACAALPTEAVISAPVDASGKHVRSVQSITVTFTKR